MRRHSQAFMATVINEWHDWKKHQREGNTMTDTNDNTSKTFDPMADVDSERARCEAVLAVAIRLKIPHTDPHIDQLSAALRKRSRGENPGVWAVASCVALEEFIAEHDRENGAETRRDFTKLPGTVTAQHQHDSSDSRQMDQYLTEALRRIETLESENRDLRQRIYGIDNELNELGQGRDRVLDRVQRLNGQVQDLSVRVGENASGQEQLNSSNTDDICDLLNRFQQLSESVNKRFDAQARTNCDTVVDVDHADGRLSVVESNYANLENRLTEDLRRYSDLDQRVHSCEEQLREAEESIAHLQNQAHTRPAGQS